MKFWLKACPRCLGDLEEDEDRFGLYISCVQCGHILRAEEEAALLMRTRDDHVLVKQAA